MATSQGGDISLARVQAGNWLMLAVMAGVAWLTVSGFVASSIGIGGAAANLSFIWLKRDLQKLLGGSLEVASVRFFIRYYLRLSVVVAVLFFLVKYGRVHTIGLLIGLSTVFLSILMAVAGAGKRLYFNVKEAS